MIFVLFPYTKVICRLMNYCHASTLSLFSLSSPHTMVIHKTWLKALYLKTKYLGGIHFQKKETYN